MFATVRKAADGKCYRYVIKKAVNMPGYQMEKRDLQTDKLIDCLYGAAEYSMKYYLDNPTARYLEHKSF